MEEKKQYTALTIDRAAFLLLRVKKAFKKKKLQRKEREKSAQLAAAARIDQRASCAGLETARGAKKAPPPLLRSRTLPAIVVPGVNILQAQLGNCNLQELQQSNAKLGLPTRYHSARVSFSRDDGIALDVRRKSAISRLCTGGNYGPDRGADGTLLLRVPAPHVVAARAYRITSPSGGGTPLCRLSRLLNQGSKSQMVVDDAPRRLSWERKENVPARLPRSSSVDSMVEAVWAESVSSEAAATKRTSPRADRTPSLVSPSVGRRMKGQRGVNGLATGRPEMEAGDEGAPRPPPPPPLRPPDANKAGKKQAKLLQQRMDRLARVNIHLQALFVAVEQGHLEKARTILESTDVDVNSINSDGLSPLDVAVLSNNRLLVKMLVGFGAKEGNQFSSPDKLGAHLKHLLTEAEMRLQELGGCLPEDPCTPLNTRASFSSIIGGAYPAATSAMTGCAGGDTDRQASAWARRAKTLKRLVLGFAQARPPDPPATVAADVTAPAAVTVRLQEPVSGESAVTTKFRVQWSTRADFNPVTGETEIVDLSRPTCVIELTQGRRYFFRASCGNLKGYGGHLASTPASVVPSSWREVERKEARFEGRLKQLGHVLEEVRLIRPGSSDILENQGPQRRTQRKKTTIKQLFTAASKFQKNLRRGIYLACILYHEDKVLVTNEDFLPVIEIDETFPSCIHSDHHWLMKVACTWDDIKSLRADMEKNASSAAHFRLKLLSAALQMQSALCLQDLGQLYYKPLRDSQGTVVLSAVNYVKAPKSVSVLNSRWLPMNKVFKKMVLSDDHSISEILMASIQDQINYHQVSSLKLNRGLYVAYLKMQSSVDLIQMVVPAKSPNMLPHCKVRDNPHVSAEEWEYLKQLHLPDVTDNATEQQRTFLELLTSAAKRLFNYMEISNEDAANHRLYDAEVIDLTEDVSFIVVCPSAEMSCSVPGQREILLQRGDLLSLPIQVFEMIHLNTYQSSIIQKYSKLSCLLELDAATANHLHREAFSNSEVAVAKERLTKLQDLQTKLNAIWRSVRWLMDVITFARDRSMNGVSMKHIFDKETLTVSSSKCTLLQLPPRDSKIMKTTPGRGSWPGPGATNCTTNAGLVNEFSKSEQHLSTNESMSQYLNVCSDESRKNSESFGSDCRLPPSRSEDMLFAVPTTTSKMPSISATSSPLLNVRPIYSGSLVSVNTLNTTNTSDSMHSLSSDSDASCSVLAGAGTPGKTRQKNKIAPSRSMTNVKQFAGEKPEKYRPKHLSVEPHYPNNVTNLDSSLSKSLTNLKSFPEVEITKTYIKPMECVKKPDLVVDPIFKVPLAETATTSKEQPSGIIQVYAAYETGLASGTSLKLHVTPRTTAREVVDLVVKQLNMAVVLKGKEGPIYPTEKFKNFCLVAVIGARERCLRDDFKPLQLQNPWKKGRLYVRQKQDVLAALEHSSKHSAII